MKTAKIICLSLVAAGGLLTLFLLSRTATHDRTWVETQARLPQIEFDGDLVTVRNIRNFAYAADQQVIEVGYYSRIYDASQLTSVWYGISHFAKFEGLAHTFLSFGFANGTYLALSIEARRESGESYSPLRGLIRSYELIYVLADERDVIGVRSHIRRERVQLHRLELATATMIRLFRAMLTDAQALNAQPRFYNTLIHNCTTGIIEHARRVPAWRRFLDYRIVLPGYSDSLAFDLRLLGNSKSLTETRLRATINPARVSLDAVDFSAALREQLG